MDPIITNTIIPPVFKLFLDTLLKPRLEEINQRKKINKEEIIQVFNHFLKRSYNTYKIMNTIVFRNDPIEIYDLYCPLTLVRNDEEFYIDNFPNELIKKFKKIVITDDAGMGKSTILKWIFVNAIHDTKKIPIFIELRKLNNENTILKEIFKELSGINKILDEDSFYEMLNNGEFIFLLDGFDEISLQSIKAVTEDLQHFISLSDNNYFILTSRPQSTVSTFHNFYEFRIKSLNNEEAFDLIRKYDRNHIFAETLISIIDEKDELNNLEEFLSNPLMVSLLYKGYEYKQTIPYKKSLFYRQVYDALFEDHDLVKDGAFIHTKLSSLDSDNFHTVLRALGFITFKLREIEYSKDDISMYLRQVKQITSQEFDVNSLLNDLVQSVPLFYKDGLMYRWKHKSLQEYFAAQFICIDSKGKQEELMLNIYSSSNFDDYLNVLDLCFDIDTKTFNKTILYKFLKEVEKEFEKSKSSAINVFNDIKGLFIMDKHFIASKSELSNTDMQSQFSMRDLLFEIEEKYLEKFDLQKNNFYRYSATMYGNSSFISTIYRKRNYKLIEILAKKNIDIFVNSNKYLEDLVKRNYIIGEDFSEIEYILANSKTLNYVVLDSVLIDKIVKDQQTKLLDSILTYHIETINSLKTFYGVPLVLSEEKVIKLREKIDNEVFEEEKMASIFNI